MRVTYANLTYDCIKAVRKGDNAALHLTDGGVVEFVGVSKSAWAKFQFEGGSWYQPPLEEVKAQRIAQSKTDLAAYLQSHPIQWTDGKFYSITREKQQQLTSKLFAASAAKQAGTEYELKWNSTGDECVEWTLEGLFKLAFYIDSRVTALVSYQQALEKQINACQTEEEIEAIVIDYDSVK